MFEEHPAFDTPPNETKLWRYMDLPKFVSLLTRRELFFSRADKLGDPYEGWLTKPTWAAIQAQAATMDPQTRVTFLDGMAESFRPMPAHCLVSCWYAAEEESPAMWGNYAHGSYGIAIQSTVVDLTTLLTTVRPYWIGKVRYVNYDTEIMPTDNAMWGVTHKREAFRNEQEVRAVIWDNAGYPGMPLPASLRIEPEFAEGLYVPAQIEALIRRVFVAPTATPWYFDAVQRCVGQFGLPLHVQQSEFGKPPDW